MRSVLIDSGPLIALFAVDDRHHARFDQLVSDLSASGLRLLTTWPCIVEASYLLGVEATTGQTRFRVERPTQAHTGSPNAYTTPTVARRGQQVEIVVTGGDVVTGHDPATGKELWRANGLNPDNNPYYRIVASPVASADLVVAPTRVKPMLVLKAFGSGDG